MFQFQVFYLPCSSSKFFTWHYLTGSSSKVPSTEHVGLYPLLPGIYDYTDNQGLLVLVFNMNISCDFLKIKSTGMNNVVPPLTLFIPEHKTPYSYWGRGGKIIPTSNLVTRSPNLVRCSRNLQQMFILVSCFDYKCLWACTCTAQKIVHAPFSTT